MPRACKKNKIENLEKVLESQTKLIIIELIDMSGKLEKHFKESKTLMIPKALCV